MDEYTDGLADGWVDAGGVPSVVTCFRLQMPSRTGCGSAMSSNRDSAERDMLQITESLSPRASRRGAAASSSGHTASSAAYLELLPPAALLRGMSRSQTDRKICLGGGVREGWLETS